MKLRSAVLVVFLCYAHSAGAATVNFAGLTPGTAVGNQLQSQGVTFLPYNGVSGVIRAAPTGNVAQFDSCFACEFFNSGGRVVFSTLHQTVTFHAGLASTTPPVSGPLLMQVYDAQGNVLGSTSVNVTSGTDFTTAVTVTVPTARIAAASIELGQSIAETDAVAISDVSFEDNVTMLPDFSLDAFAAVSVLAGGPPTSVNVTTLRIGGSAGAIKFTISGLPPGVSASFSPNPATGTSVVLQLTAAANAPEFATNATITGLPNPAAGPQARLLTLGVATHRPLAMAASPAVVDFSLCSSPDLTNGNVTATVEVTRDPNVSGPLALTLSGLPANVSSSFAPATITFPGGAIRQSVVLTLTALDGVALSPAFVTLQASGGGQQVSTTVLVQGTCPRNNKDFTIQGSFFCNNLGSVLPLAHAQIEINRVHSAYFDDLVGSTLTDDNGAYSLHLHARDLGDYYARVRLDDKNGVHLNDNWTTSMWSWDAPHISNSNLILDEGAITFSRDNGQGTPKCAIWTGAHTAWNEAIKVTGGFLPPTGDYSITIWKVAQVPWSSLATTNWPDNSPTAFGIKPRGLPTTAFTDYITNFHEFGHTMRHTLDGDTEHWISDAATYNYAHGHSHCDGNNDGFAFNEGWAEFWSKDVGCCPEGTKEQNFQVEGTVAHDLDNLSQCPGVGRNGMLQVLEQGIGIVHSAKDFHAFFLQRFPNCQVPPPNQGCPAPGPARGGGCTVVPSTEPRGEPEQPLDPHRQRESLLLAITEQSRAVARLRAELDVAKTAAGSITRCASSDCGDELSGLVRAATAQSAVEQAELLLEQLKMQKRLLDRGDFLRQVYAVDFVDRWRVNALLYDQARRQSVLKAVREAARSIDRLRSSDRSGAVAARIDDLGRRARLLDSPDVRADSLLSFVKFPPTVLDDAAMPATNPTQETPSSRRWIIALAVALGSLLLLGTWLARRKSHNT